MARPSVRVAVSLLLAAGLVVLFLWNVDLAEVGRVLASAHFGWLAAAITVALASYGLRAVRWGFILRPAGRASLTGLLLVTAVGYAAITLLPARMGDVLRPLLLAQREELPASACLASVLTERIFDLWTVVFFLLLFVAWPPPMDLDAESARHLHTLTTTGYIIAAAVVLATLVLLGLFRYQERFIEALTRPLSRVLPARWQAPIRRFLGHFLDGLRILQRPRDLALTLGLSVGVWGLIYLQAEATLLAFNVVLPLRATFVLVALTVVGLAIPTPGGVGGFHKALQVGLTLFFGVGLGEATGIAIAYHAVCFLPITLIGLAAIPVLGVSWRQMGGAFADTGEGGD